MYNLLNNWIYLFQFIEQWKQTHFQINQSLDEDDGILDHIMKTHASLPGLNPIENVWASVKQYLFNVHKPRRKYELVGGIKAFWASLTAVQFGRYIDHIHRSSDSYIVLIKGDTFRYVCQWTLSVKLWFGLVWCVF